MRCYSTVTDKKNRPVTTFADFKNTDNIDYCKRIIVNAANKEIRILTNVFTQFQIVGCNWEAFKKRW